MTLLFRKKWLPLAALAVLAAAASLAVLVSSATAQSPIQPTVPPAVPVGKTFSYAAKFTCGLVPQNRVPLDPRQATAEFPPTELPLKPANYATDINVHNPQFKATVLWKKAVLSGWIGIPGAAGGATSEPEQRFDGGKYFPVQLPPDGAFSVDCADIVKVLHPPGPSPYPSFITGFVVINSPVELDVTAVYTSERQDAPVIHCLLSNGQIVAATPNAAGTPECPTAANGVSTISMSVTQTGTGLTMDVESITPKSVAFVGHD